MAVFFPEKGCFLTHFWDLQDLRILRGPKMENRSPPGPQLCYLFQAGIPKIGLLGQINGVLTSFGGQNSVPQRGNLSWGPQIWPFWPNPRPLISDLGLPDPRSGVSDPKSGLPETQFWVKIGQSGHSGLPGTPFWPPRGQNRPQICPPGGQKLTILPNFPHFFKMRKIAQFIILDYIF